MRSFRRVFLLLAALSVVAASSAGAAEPAPQISDLTATTALTGTLVKGKAAFASPAAELATDKTGDAAVANAGMDLTKATIAQIDTKTLSFRWGVADQTPNFSAVPQLVYYNWNIEVTNGTNKANFNVQAIRSDAYSVATAGAEPGAPVFRLQTCTPNPTTGGQSCSVVAQLTGTFGSGYVEAVVPLATISAKPGSVVGPAAVPINTNFGFGATWYNGGNNAWADAISAWTPYAVSNTVKVGTALAGTDPAAVEATTPATLKTTGGFEALLPTVASGDVIVAEACAAAVCTRTSTVAP